MSDSKTAAAQSNHNSVLDHAQTNFTIISKHIDVPKGFRVWRGGELWQKKFGLLMNQMSAKKPIDCLRLGQKVGNMIPATPLYKQHMKIANKLVCIITPLQLP